MTVPIICIIAACLAGGWQVFEKAGIPGWKVLVPVYNKIMVLRLIRRPDWWLLLLLIPGVNIFIGVIMVLEIGECFKQNTLFGAGLALLPFIFLPLLGYGSAKYCPPER